MRGSTRVDLFSLATRGINMNRMNKNEKTLRDTENPETRTVFEAPSTSYTVKTTTYKPSDLESTRKKLSGAQKRKLAIQAALARGEPVRPRSRKSKTEKTCTPSSSQQPITSVHSSSVNIGNKRIRCDNSLFPSLDKRMRKDEAGVTLPAIETTRRTGYSTVLASAKMADEAGITLPVIESTRRTGYSTMFASTKMAIVPVDFPKSKLSEEQISLLRAKLLQEVFKCEAGTGPQFRNSYSDSGILYVTCTDEAAKTWLETRIPRLMPWEGAALRAGPAREIVKIIKAVVWVPFEQVGITEPRKILTLLKTQNLGLNTDEWSIISSKHEETGVTLVLGIDNGSLEVLRKTGLKSYLGLTQLTFRVPEKKETETVSTEGYYARHSGAH